MTFLDSILVQLEKTTVQYISSVMIVLGHLGVTEGSSSRSNYVYIDYVIILLSLSYLVKYSPLL